MHQEKEQWQTVNTCVFLSTPWCPLRAPSMTLALKPDWQQVKLTMKSTWWPADICKYLTFCWVHVHSSHCWKCGLELLEVASHSQFYNSLSSKSINMSKGCTLFEILSVKEHSVWSHKLTKKFKTSNIFCFTHKTVHNIKDINFECFSMLFSVLTKGIENLILKANEEIWHHENIIIN